MKSVMVLWCFVVGIFVLLALGFAFMVQQQQASSAAVRDVLGKVATYDATLKKMDAAVKTHDADIKNLQGTMSSASADTIGLNEKVAGLIQQVNEVKAQLQSSMQTKDVASAASPAASVAVSAPAALPEPAAVPTPDIASATPASSVELGTIPVEK